MPSPTRIDPHDLFRLVGTPDAPTILDVRIDEDAAADPRLIPGSARRSHHAVADAAEAEALRGRPVVVSCQRGLKLSQGAAAWLRVHGVEAMSLVGGFEAWREAGLPLLRTAILPPRDSHGRTVWVTRERPKVDRIACPWLIRRFVDPHAVFLYVSAAEVAGVAERFGATPFDVEGAFWGHRGDLCTFDTMIAEFGLRTPGLDRLAAIVRGADCSRPDLAPEAAGLLAASRGLSQMFARDLDQLQAGLTLYDAFYRWSRDAAHESPDKPAVPSAAAQLRDASPVRKVPA
ncbi:MAG TPA: sulfurtransferase/chromate resistance protein [Microvirga sp.]|nr:sulfurtransferase/chromate resistance protein [Microvirga sp.]